MICSKCASALNDMAIFCSQCGTRIDEGLGAVPTGENSVPDQRTKVGRAVETARQALGRTANTVTGIATTVGNQICDLNGDGKVDSEDLKIAVAKVRAGAAATANEAAKLGKDVLKSDLVKDVAAAAAVGAVIAVPVPVVGPVAGATVGAALGVYRNVTKK